MKWKTYRNEGSKGPKNSPLISSSERDEEELMKVSPRSVINLIRQRILHIPPLPTPPPVSLPSPPSSPVPPSPPLRDNMVSAIKLSVFKGVGNEDPDQFWFVIRVVWEAKGVTNDNINKKMLVNTLQDHALTSYIKHSNDNLNVEIVDIQIGLNREFSRFKPEVQSIIGFKEIIMLPGETPWELDQRLKCTIRDANMTLMNGQHCKWFVASLTSQLRNALS